MSIGIYINQFSQSELSTDSANWGAFGDFFGGIFNPLIGIANIIILVYISILVSNYEDRRWKQTLIHEQYTLLLNELEKVKMKTVNNSDINNLVSFLYSFGYHNSFLFENHEADFKKLCFKLSSDIISIQVTAKKYFDKDENIDVGHIRDKFLLDINLGIDESIDYELISSAVTRFELRRHQLLSFIKSFLLNKGVKNILSENIEENAKDWDSKFNPIRFKQLKDKIQSNTN